jgi:hypothetical protein
MRDRSRVGGKWDRRGRYKRGVILLEEDIRECHSPKRPQLAKNKAALLMHGIGDPFPTFYLFLGIDPWDVVHPTSSLGYDGRFGDEKCSRCGCTLCVVGDCMRPEDVGGVDAKTGEGCEDDAVADAHVAHLDGGKEGGRHRAQ